MNPNSRDGQGSQNRFAERQGYCCIRAEHFCTRQDTPEGGWQVIDYLGREGSAIRTLPPMQSWEDTFKAPSVTYRMIAEHDGPYGIRFYLMAANPSVRGGRMQFGLSVNGEAPRRICGVSDNYYTEWFDPQWAEGVLSHVHLVQSQADLVRGENEIRIISLDPGVILEKVVIYPSDRPLPDSYFGPEESCRI